MLVPRNDDAARILSIRAIEAAFGGEIPVINQRGADHRVIFFEQRLRMRNKAGGDSWVSGGLS